MTAYNAYSAFTNRILQPNKGADSFMVEITQLGQRCGITNDIALACKFVSRLPINIRTPIMLQIGFTPSLVDAVSSAQILLSRSCNRNSEYGFVSRQVYRPYQTSRV